MSTAGKWPDVNRIDEVLKIHEKDIRELKDIARDQSHSITELGKIVERNSGIIFGVPEAGELKGGIIPRLTKLQTTADQNGDLIREHMKQGALTKKQKYTLYGSLLSVVGTTVGMIYHIMTGK